VKSFWGGASVTLELFAIRKEKENEKDFMARLRACHPHSFQLSNRFGPVAD
jgi:hypothetical protein